LFDDSAVDCQNFQKKEKKKKKLFYRKLTCIPVHCSTYIGNKVQQSQNESNVEQGLKRKRK